MRQRVEREAVEVLDLDQVGAGLRRDVTQCPGCDAGPLLERGGGTGRDHTVGKVTVDITDEDHRDVITAFGEPAPQARDHGTGSPWGEWCEFGGDEDDVHGAIVAESVT